jgi:hypothetical protein
MTDLQFQKLILSPEDAATRKRWRRAVCTVYAGIILVLAAVWGSHHLAASTHARTAGPAAPAMEARHSQSEVWNW